jgi:hypothetical protein
MILTAILIIFVLAIAFFHYTQGFFSATVSAALTVIAAVLAFSYHEPLVESLLGGRFADQAHGMALAVLFAGIYLVLRVAFDAMVPGNMRFPVIVDKIGGAAMGLVAAVFAVGIIAIVAQYLPMSPAVGGYSRYATEGTRSVTVPPEGSGGRRAMNSETWDPLKSEKPGAFEEADRQAMLLPVDDVVVNTVARLSDGGSLGWDRPLKDVHPDFLGEVFAQRLGIQPKASRVTPPKGLKSVDLFRVDTLERRDHEYKDVRSSPMDVTPLKPKQNEVVVVARVIFDRPAKDSGDLVRFSPGSVRLVARKGTGGDAQWVNYHPVGTVDGAKTLYASALDDFLFVDAKGTDSRGADLAFVVDKSALEGGQGGPMKFAPGSFIEVKRMARQELTDETIQPPTAYKASEDVLVIRKQGPKKEEEPPAADAGGAPAGGGAGAVDAHKARLVGNWAGTSDTGSLIIEFKADGSLTFNNTPRGGVPSVGQGTWEVDAAKTTADTLVITRTINNQASENSIKFTDDNNMTLTSPGRPPLTLQKR